MCDREPFFPPGFVLIVVLALLLALLLAVAL